MGLQQRGTKLDPPYFRRIRHLGPIQQGVMQQKNEGYPKWLGMSDGKPCSLKQYGQAKVWEDSCLDSEGFVVVDHQNRYENNQ